MRKAIIAAVIVAAAHNFKLQQKRNLWIRISIYINTTNIDFGYLFWLTGLEIMSENHTIDLHSKMGARPNGQTEFDLCLW